MGERIQRCASVADPNTRMPARRIRIRGIKIDLPPRPWFHPRSDRAPAAMLPSRTQGTLARATTRPVWATFSGRLTLLVLSEHVAEAREGWPQGTNRYGVSELLRSMSILSNDIRSHIRRSVAELAALPAPVVAMESSLTSPSFYTPIGPDAASRPTVARLGRIGAPAVDGWPVPADFGDLRAELGTASGNQALETVGEPPSASDRS